MGEVKPLTLKRQRASSESKLSAQQEDSALQVEVQLDSGVFHLDQSFSYLVSSNLTARIHVGSIVQVPFRNESKIGVVVGLGPKKRANLLAVEKVLVEYGCSDRYLEFLEKVAARYIATVGQVQKLFLSQLNMRGGLVDSIPFELVTNARTNPRFLPLGIGEMPDELISKLAKLNRGSRVIIFPTERELNQFKEALSRAGNLNFVEYGSHLTLSDRRKSLHKLLNSHCITIIGLRNAIFAPARDLAEIIVVDEFSRHYIDRRAPYWNLRDVALLRAEAEGCELSFIGSSASLELWRLIETQWIKMIIGGRSNKPRVAVTSLPETFHSTIREGIKEGPVLVSVSSKEYAAGFICKKCRNRAKCNCGHPLILESKTRIACTVCDKSYGEWRCIECDNGEMFTFKAGASRVKEEIGKAFPRTKVFISTADKPLLEIEDGNAIVISTHGMEPATPAGYAAIVLLDGEQLSARAMVRADEELFQRWNKILSLLADSGKVYLSLLRKHPIAQAISANKIKLYLDSALTDRREVNLPPYSRVIQIQGEMRAISALRTKLMQSFPADLATYLSHSGGMLTVKASHELMPQLQSALKALQKLRSAAGKELLRIVVDPIDF